MSLFGKTIILFCILLLFFVFVRAQQYTISGYITDSISGETLIGTNVYEINKQKGTATNTYGFYSLTLPRGQTSIRCSYVGYITQVFSFELTKDTIFNIKLKSSNQLEEVVIVGEHENSVRTSQMSTIEIPLSQIKAVPMIFGEVDVIKTLQLLPGVSSGSEGSAGVYVRGGGPDENLLLLDGVPVYNVNHALGFFSVFNADAVKNVTLYKGSFPAHFGGRLSSVIDVQMKDGDDKKYHGNINVGLISSKINLEGPIIKEKTTFNISARRTYIDILAKPILAYVNSQTNSEKLTAGYYFYDLNAKITHKFSDKDRLFLSFYGGDDVVYIKTKDKSDNYYGPDYNSYGYEYNTKMNWNWGNIIGALRWNHIINNKLFMNTTASYTRYRSHLGILDESEYTYPVERKELMSMGYNSGIDDLSLKIDFDYIPNPNHNIKFGVNYIYHTFRPGVTAFKQQGYDEDINETIGDKNIYANETMLYIEDDITINNLLKVNAGLHYSTFNVQNKFYHSLQPRVSLRLMINENLSFKSGYALMNQYIHLLSNNSISMPTDLWVPSTKRIEPMVSNQVAAGFFYTLKNIADFSVEGYYKWMNNLIEYKDGASFMGSVTGWEEKVSMGKGWAYGVEVLVQRTFGKTTGWIGYTWSKSDRLFDRPGEELNYGKIFPAKYDKRHDISITASHKFSDRFDIALTWVYSTGNAGTLALQNYQSYPLPDVDVYFYLDSDLPYISSRNNYRYNDYHRLDLGMNFRKKKKRGERIWNISIYNVYSQLNPFLIYVDETGEYDPNINMYVSKKKLKQVSLFPIIPSVSYTFKF